MRTKLSLLLTALFFLALSSCTKEGVDVEYNYYDKDDFALMSKTLNLSETPLTYANDFPSYYTGFSTPFDKDIATLGRVLFYDNNLSKDLSVSCASCHDQKAGFADNKAFSDGVEGKVTSRNSLALGSVFSFNEYYGHISFGRVPFFWDNRAASVQEQSEQTLGNPLEMNMKMHEVVAAVNSQAYYAPLLKAAFGTEVANEQSVLDAISIFVNSISSFNSKYDDALSAYFDKHNNLDNIETEDLPLLSAAENRGKAIYMESCASCHGTTNGFPGLVMADNGLDAVYTDLGMGGISSKSTEMGVFKVPTLRNITLTAPYMHDGRFATLDAVLDHYSNGIQKSENLSPLLRVNEFANGEPKKFDFTAAERADLIAFMKTFDDEVMANAEKYSDPFKR